MKWLMVAIMISLFPYKTMANDYRPWAVYYDQKESIEILEKYKLLVLDSKFHPPLRPLIDQGTLILGYISLGEIEQHRHYFKKAKDKGILLKENKDWPGSYYVDMRHNWWAEYVITTLIPSLLHKGFNGIFLDTLDNPIELEREDSQTYKGMSEAAIQLVKAIRLHYPRIKIMVNRGYEIWPSITRDIDMVLGESMYADYNFTTKTNGFVEHEEYQAQIDWLNSAKEENPKLGIYTLDYWDKNDKEGIKEIYNTQRRNGFNPYVATVELDEIIPEPEVP